MRSKDAIKENFEVKFASALESNDAANISAVFADFATELQNEILKDAQAYKESGDATILSNRGVRVLTSKETEYYSNLINAMKSNDIKSAITNIGQALPETVIESVLEDVYTEFPVLGAIDVMNTKTITKMILNTKGTQLATWGALNSAITKELSGSIAVIEVDRCKLSAYMPVSQDMLLEGPAWVDAYVRGILAESIGLGLSGAVITGNGLDQPIGMVKDLDADISQSTGYADKTAIAISDFGAATFGVIGAALAVDANGRTRNVPEIMLLVNPVDYFTKVMPATTFLTQIGTYAKDVFPYAVNLIKDPSVPTGKAVAGLAKNYKLYAGTGATGGKIEYSDEYQFLEDNRIYKIKLYANGRPTDNTSFVVLDLSAINASNDNEGEGNGEG